MTFYPPKIHDRFRYPSNIGSVADANAVGKSASFVCGSFVSYTIRIDEQTGRIEEIMSRTNGCGFMIAAADALSDRLRGKSVADLHGLDDSALNAFVGDELGEFPPERTQCADVVFEALRAAMAAYRRYRIEEFQGEKALICTCFGVSEETIVSVIAENRITEVDQVGEIARAGSGCGSCRMLIRELIDSNSDELRRSGSQDLPRMF